jgi:ABC-type Zn uptake system ZnuABC Zn-binding protein ZnuA
MYAATLAVVADWARALELPVALLQPRSADAHETPLNVRMVRTALQAKVVLAIGGGLEGYLPALRTRPARQNAHPHATRPPAPRA